MLWARQAVLVGRSEELAGVGLVDKVERLGAYGAFGGARMAAQPMRAGDALALPAVRCVRADVARAAAIENVYKPGEEFTVAFGRTKGHMCA